MKKILIFLIIFVSLFFSLNSEARILFGAIAGGGTNDAGGFDWSAVKVAEYRFAPSALGTDSSSGGNTLTVGSGVTSNTVYYQADGGTNGSGKWDQTANAYAYRADGDLSAGFPGKSSGGNKNFLVMGWYVPYEVTVGGILLSKYYAATGERSWEVQAAANAIKVFISSNGTSADILNYTFSAANGGFSMATGNNWYHFALWFDSTLNKCGIIIYNTESGEKTYSVSAGGLTTYLGTASFGIGMRRSSGGTISSTINGIMEQVVLYSWSDGSGPTEQQILNQVAAVRGGTLP
jgi:hypothetical protein